MCTIKGFRNTRIEEVLKTAGVPKGSFYHYFPSKEAFGEEVIQQYADYFYRKLERFLGEATQPPVQRLQAFVRHAQENMVRFSFQRGCLVGNLGQELGDANDAFRAQLERVLQSWQTRTAACLAEAVQAGQICADSDPQALAEFFWIGWEGAILRAKLAKSVQPMERFSAVFFEQILRVGDPRRPAGPGAAG
ncbi:TetR/AcrR family transcriptional regulator [Orrella sp. JC864]